MKSPRKIVGIAVSLVILFHAALFFTGMIKVFRVPTNGMAPSITTGDWVVVERISHLFRLPRVGEVVLFITEGLPPPAPPGQLFMKRLAALPGESVCISGGKLLVNGQTRALTSRGTEIHYTNQLGAIILHSSSDVITVPPGTCLVLGDNSANSMDGRFFGFVPLNNLRGRVVGR